MEASWFREGTSFERGWLQWMCRRGRGRESEKQAIIMIDGNGERGMVRAKEAPSGIFK